MVLTAAAAHERSVGLAAAFAGCGCVLQQLEALQERFVAVAAAVATLGGVTGRFCGSDGKLRSNVLWMLQQQLQRRMYYKIFFWVQQQQLQRRSLHERSVVTAL